jgi:hypothetical protein
MLLFWSVCLTHAIVKHGWHGRHFCLIWHGWHGQHFLLAFLANSVFDSVPLLMAVVLR